MTEVVVAFVGVCTHVPHVPLTPPPDAVAGAPLPGGRYHRAVFVNAGLGMHLHGRQMPPHDSLLVIPRVFLDAPDRMSRTLPGLEHVANDDAATWLMRGVSLYVADATTRALDVDDWLGSIPSLTMQSDALSLQLDERVVTGGRAAGTFDAFGGTLVAASYDDSVCTELAIETDAAKPRLIARQTWDQERTEIVLRSAIIEGDEVPPCVLVMNVGRERDDEHDFLLHYNVTTSTPATVRLPEAPASGIRPLNPNIARFIPIGLTVGCSNSVYP